MVNIESLEIGKTLGQSIANATAYKQDFVETEDVSAINLVAIESVQLTGSYFIYTKTLNTSSFVLDHPIYGRLNGSYYINGNIASSTLHGSGLL